jgi:drug/metabolite transporter (DMT)-like permease
MPPTSPAAKPPGGFGAPFAALVAGALAMGVSPIFVRLADVGPFASAFWRVALALPLLWAWLKLSEKEAPAGSGIGRADLLAGLAFACDLFFWHLSIVTTSVANATFFATTAPIWVVAFGWLLLGERAAPRTLIGVALCVAGGLALLAQSFHLRPAGAIGDLYGAATGLFFGLYFLAVKAARRVHSAARVTFIATLVTAALLLVVALALEPTILPHSLAGIAALCAMAWISHAGGQGLLSIALGRLPAAFSSLVIFLEAIAAAGFAYLLLGEPVSLTQAFGGLAILAGIYVARPT